MDRSESHHSFTTFVMKYCKLWLHVEFSTEDGWAQNDGSWCRCVPFRNVLKIWRLRNTIPSPFQCNIFFSHTSRQEGIRKLEKRGQVFFQCFCSELQLLGEGDASISHFFTCACSNSYRYWTNDTVVIIFVCQIFIQNMSCELFTLVRSEPLAPAVIVSSV